MKMIRKRLLVLQTIWILGKQSKNVVLGNHNFSLVNILCSFINFLLVAFNNL